jgi:glutaredoxin-like YruB-family protein
MIDERTIAQPKVTVYSTPNCPYCVMAKRYLSEKGVKYEDVDVSRDQARALEMLTKSGQMGVPVLDIGGQVIIGFDRNAIDSALMMRR